MVKNNTLYSLKKPPHGQIQHSVFPPKNLLLIKSNTLYSLKQKTSSWSKTTLCIPSNKKHPLGQKQHSVFPQVTKLHSEQKQHSIFPQTIKLHWTKITLCIPTNNNAPLSQKITFYLLRHEGCSRPNNNTLLTHTTRLQLAKQQQHSSH